MIKHRKGKLRQRLTKNLMELTRHVPIQLTLFQSPSPYTHTCSKVNGYAPKMHLVLPTLGPRQIHKEMCTPHFKNNM